MKIDLHNITRCGFYEQGSARMPLFGDLSAWHNDFIKWVQGRQSVALTTTFQDQDAKSPMVYCAGTVQQGSGFGLILWHGVPATEKGIAYIKMDAPPGKVDAQEAQLDQNSIPGWPSYFWILPQQGLLARLQPTGKIRNRSTGLPACRDYLQGWLRSHSCYVERIARSDAPDGAEFEIAWRPTVVSASRTDLSVHFESQPLTTPCALDEIRRRHDEIRKLVHSVQINRALPADHNWLNQLMSVMGFDGFSSPETDRLSFRWDTDWRPELAELEMLISRQNVSGERDRRERQAVRLKGDPHLYWLDGGPVRDEVLLPDDLEHALHWSPQQLEQAWSTATSQVLGWLREQS